jgi:hypothetical protein
LAAFGPFARGDPFRREADWGEIYRIYRSFRNRFGFAAHYIERLPEL